MWIYFYVLGINIRYLKVQAFFECEIETWKKVKKFYINFIECVVCFEVGRGNYVVGFFKNLFDPDILTY